jgi:hypothetical protein
MAPESTLAPHPDLPSPLRFCGDLPIRHAQLVENDAGVVLVLLNARYYESARGQFVSQDPSFLSVGDPSAVKRVTDRIVHVEVRLRCPISYEIHSLIEKGDLKEPT